MSHQTGITASPKLREFFAASKDGNVRLIKVAIENEQLVLESSAAGSGETWEQEYNALVKPCLEDRMPCYILFRLDSKDDVGYQWLYITYSPDFAPVRQKMLYAATRSTLKTEFGGGQISDELFGTEPADVSLAGYKKHLVSQSAPAPLSNAEEEKEAMRKLDATTNFENINVDTKQSTMTGVSFPIEQEALQALMQLKAGQITYVQLKLDIKEEKIMLAMKENVDSNGLARKIPKDQARYHFFIFKHTHEGDYLQSIVFIYSMPGYVCPIKERMLYSSCKGPLLDIVEQQLEMEIVKKMEIDDPSEVTAEFLQDEVHPKKDIVRQKFARPKPPPGRGPKRLTKKQGGEGDE